MVRKLMTVLLFTFLAAFLSTGAYAGTEKATFAGGCFWCMEPPFEKLEGVEGAVSGFMGGDEVSPTYKEVSSGRTGHMEVVQVTFDPEVVSYARLLDVYWRQVDPTDAGGQFVDRGSQYRTAIFYHNEEQKRAAEESKKWLEKTGLFTEPIVTPILEAKEFYRAEEYHQDFYRKSVIKYKFYRYNSGRDRFIDRVWEGFDGHFTLSGMTDGGVMDGEDRKYTRPSDEEIKRRLTRLQYNVTQRDATERAFANEYWDNKRAGIYVDIVSGEPLFSSTDKFVSGTGWPSFTRPLEPGNIVEREDRRLFSVRTEVRSRHGDSHLGHVFEDGPPPTGLRYCINSAALRFIPAEDLESEGYGEYAGLFDK